MSGRSVTALVGGAVLLLITPLLVVVMLFMQQQEAAACPVATAALPAAAVAGGSGGQRAAQGSGLTLGALPALSGVGAGVPVTGTIRTAIANLPERQRSHRAADIARMATTRPDFMMLNEISSSSASKLAAVAPGYAAYKDPVQDRAAGGSQSQDTAVMWDASKWRLMAAGRYQFVAHDRVMYSGHAKDWNRYATWAVLRRASDGAQVAIISAHHMTNPKHTRAPAGYQGPSRYTLYAQGMQRLAQLIQTLAPYGPVLLGGDMNSHPHDGGWDAVNQMASIGYGYSTDGVIVYQFIPHGTSLAGKQYVDVHSDHNHALVTDINMNGVSTSDLTGAPPSSGGGGAVPAAAALSTGNTSCCPTGSGAGAIGGAATVPGLNAEQLANARILVSKGVAAGGTPAAVVGVTVALDESGLHTDPGSTGGAYGLMQQTPPAWGTKAQVMDPSYAAAKFYSALAQIPGWQSVEPWHAAQMVQHSGAGDANGNGVVDPEDGKANYGKFVAQAEQIVSALAGSSGCTASVVDAAGKGAGGHFAPSTIDHVGKFDRAQLLTRMQQFIAHNNTGDLDPFFHSQSGNWYRACQHFVANLSGASSSGYGSAAAAWAQFSASGAAHPASSADGMAPPVGAWLYYGPNHVVVYLGDNQVASTDTWGDGTVNFGPASAETDGPWHLPYLGWAAPWGGK